jgi:hypothetical protein
MNFSVWGFEEYEVVYITQNYEFVVEVMQYDTKQQS